MHWTYQGSEITILPEDCEGFVYEITNTTNGRKYIGKKLAKFKTTKPPLKGKKNKTRPTGQISDNKSGHHAVTVLKHSFFLFYTYIIALNRAIVKV